MNQVEIFYWKEVIRYGRYLTDLKLLREILNLPRYTERELNSKIGKINIQLESLKDQRSYECISNNGGLELELNNYIISLESKLDRVQVEIFNDLSDSSFNTYCRRNDIPTEEELQVAVESLR